MSFKRQVESLRRPESSGGIEAKNTDGRVRRGRKPKQDSEKLAKRQGMLDTIAILEAMVREQQRDK